MKVTNELPPNQQEELLKTLKVRFEKNNSRHPGIDWAQVQAKLEAPSLFHRIGGLGISGCN